MTRKLLIAPSTASRAAARTRPALKPLSLALLSVALSAQAAQPLPSTVLPSGMQVINGQASLSTQGTQLTVRNSANSILNWQSFSIGRDASVYFDQASSSSKVLNRVLGNDPSQILGRLASNGQVWLLNPNGVLFGRDARVDVASLVTSTLRLNDSDFLAGRYRFSAQAGDGGLVRNEGVLKSSLGGQVVLLGSRIENVGSVEAERGQVNLAAVQSVELVDTGAPNLSVRVDVPAGEVLNLGQLAAAGGQIDVHAASVNQQGIVRADTLSTDAQGRIVLSASQTLNLGASSQTSADGSRGGAITLDANAGTALIEGQVSARGQAGQGGQLLLQGRQIGLLDGSLLNASGRDGGGRILVGGGAQGQDRTLRNAESVFMGQQARIQADATQQGNGGNIVLWSDKATRAYGHFSAHGGSQGGQGGFLETSGGWLDARPGSLDLSAPKGQAGNWLLDPNDITIRDTGTDTNISSGPNFSSTGDSSVITTATIAAALNAGNSVTVSTAAAGANSQAGDIDASMTLSVNPTAPVTLTLKANRDIALHDSSISSSGQALNLSLQAAGSGKGAIDVSNVSLNSNGGDLFLGGQQSIQLPVPGGFTGPPYAAAVDFIPGGSDLPRLSYFQNASAVAISSSQLNLGSGRFQSFGLGPFGGLDFATSSLIAASMQSVSAGTANGVSSITDSTLRLRDSLDFKVYGVGVDIGPRTGQGSTLTVGSTATPGTLAQIVVSSTTTSALTVRAATGQTSPVLDLHAATVRLTGETTSTSSAAAGVSLAGIAGRTTVDFGGSTDTLLFGRVGASSDALKLSSVSIVGSSSASAELAFSGGSSSGVGKVNLLNSSVAGAGKLSLSGQAVWLQQSQLRSNGSPLSITAKLSGTNALGVLVTGSTLQSGGGQIALGSAAFANDSTAALSVFNSNVDAGAGSIDLLGYGSASRGIILWGGSSLKADTIAADAKSSATTALDTQQGANLQATNLNLSGTSAPNTSSLGIALGGNTAITLTGQGSSSILGSSLLLSGTSIAGSAKQLDLKADGSIRLNTSTLDFSAGTGTNVILTADADSNKQGSVVLSTLNLKTGGGNFTITGGSGSAYGVYSTTASGTTNPAYNSQVDSGLGIQVLGTTALDLGQGSFVASAHGAQDGRSNAISLPALSIQSAGSILAKDINLAGLAGDNGTGVAITAQQTLSITADRVGINGKGAGNAFGILLSAQSSSPGSTWNVSDQLDFSGAWIGLFKTTITGPHVRFNSSDGLSINNSQIIAQDVIGKGGSAGVGSTGPGVQVNGSTISATSGDLILGMSDPIVSAQAGAGLLLSNAQLSAAGSIRLDGRGAASGQISNSSQYTSGVVLTGGSKLSAGASIALSGIAGAGGGVGVDLDGASLKAADIQITGKGATDASNTANAFGVFAHTSTQGTPTRLDAQSLDMQGTTDPLANQALQAGVYLTDASSIALSGHKTASIRGDSLVLDKAKVSGDAGSWTMASSGSMRVSSSQIDFSAGTGSSISLQANTDGSNGGRVRIEDSQIKTGGGNFSASGEGLNAIAGVSLSLAKDGSRGILLQNSSIDAGTGSAQLTAKGNGAIEVFGNAAVSITAKQIALNADVDGALVSSMMAVPGNTPGTGLTVDAIGNSAPQLALNLKAEDITINAGGLAYNPSWNRGADAVFVRSSSTWDASNSLTINGSKGGLTLGGLTMKGQNITISSAEELSMRLATVATAKNLTMSAKGGTDPSAAYGIGLFDSTTLQADTIKLDGTGQGDAGVSLSGAGSKLDAVTRIDITAKDGKSQNDSYTASNNWQLRAGDTIAINADRSLTMTEDSVGSGKPMPSYVAGKLLDIRINNSLGGTIQPQDAADFSAVIAGMPASALTRISVSGAPLSIDGTVTAPSRLQLAADSITLGSNARIIANGSGDAVVLSGSDGMGGLKSFSNLAGASALSTPNGRWVALLNDPTAEQLGGLVPDFRLYGLGLQSLPLDANGNRITPKPGSFIGYSVSLDTGGNEATRGAQSTLDSALLQVTTPVIMSTPSQSRVLDSLPGLGFDASNGNNLSFKTLNVSQMSRSELVTLLAARDNYKKKLFSDVLYKLQLDPSLADVRPCTNEAELSTGQCLITESLKQQILAARKLEQLRRDKSRKVKQATLAAIERKVALLIGINQYADKRIPELVSAVPDATAIRDLLEDKLGYETVLVENASKETIVRALNKLALESNPNDSVMIYYAGHGEVVPKTGMGYWLPSDSRVDRAESWLSNADIARLVSLIGAKQMMLVSDSCYSGTLAGSERISVDGKTEATDMLSRKAAVIMSSGGNEPVSDEGRDGHSVFAWHLMNKLGELSGWQAGGNVFERIRAAVSAEFPQTPQYGANKLAGHQGNTDYLFERREIEKNEQ